MAGCTYSLGLVMDLYMIRDGLGSVLTNALVWPGIFDECFCKVTKCELIFRVLFDSLFFRCYHDSINAASTLQSRCCTKVDLPLYYPAPRQRYQTSPNPSLHAYSTAAVPCK